MSSLPRSAPLVVLSVIAVVVVAYGGIIAGGKTWDDTRYHADVAPPRLAAASAIQHGAWPAWWDGSGLGVPLAADPSHGALYPPTWLAATPRALDLLLIAHLIWAGVGVALWARRRSSDTGAAIAGMLVATTGILASCALRGAFPAVAHVAWLGLAVEALRDADTRRARARAASAIGILIGAIALAGSLAVLIDAIVIAIAWGGSRASARWLAAAIAAGLAIGALQWLPAAFALGATAGAHVAGLAPARLADLVMPGALFVGAGTLALAAVRPIAWRELSVLGALAIAAFALPGGPIWLGAPELHLAVLAIVLAARASSGIDALLAGAARARLALAIGIAASVVVTAIVRGSALVPAACSIACLAGALALAGRPRMLAVACALLVGANVGATPSLAPIVDLGLDLDRAPALGPLADRELVTAAPPWAELAETTRSSAPLRIFRPMYLYAHPSLADAIATFAGASADRWDIAQARSDDPARPVDHDRVWLAAASEGGALLDRFGISLAVLPSTLIGARHLHALARRGSWVLVALPVAPVASVVDGWHWAVDPADALALLFSRGGGTGILRGSIVLRGAGTSRDSSADPKPCAIDTWRAGEIALACTAERDAYAVVSSSTAPGWSVTVDDRDAAWSTADVMRRAVAIGAGAHHIRWTYATPGGTAGALAAALGLLGIAAMLGLKPR